jgi:hypothetical protein
MLTSRSICSTGRAGFLFFNTIIKNGEGTIHV